jgi:RNA polymerase sigma factor (sigma-70 family)
MSTPPEHGEAAAAPGLDAWAAAAAGGDSRALEELCRGVQHPIYRLALRMTGHPEDAADATQEVMIKIITHLGQFEGRSAFMTWAYTIASRHLLAARRRRAEASVRDADAFVAFLDGHRDESAPSPHASAEYAELCAEVRLSCTYGMLLCLTRPVRLAYLLGDLLGMSDTSGAEICEITPAAFRQRLARARRTMRAIMSGRCGLIDAANPCRCTSLVRASVDRGLADPDRPAFARHRGVRATVPADTLERAAGQLDTAVAIAEVYRSDPDWLAPERVWAGLRQACPDLIG